MKLGSVTRIRKEDIPESPEWIDKLIDPMNRFFELVYIAMNRKLTIEENISGEFHTADLTAEELPYEFSIDIGRKPSAVFIAQIYEKKDDQKAATSPHVVDWKISNVGIKVVSITNLTPNTRYIVKFLVF